MIRVEELRAGYRAGFRRSWREVLQGVTFHVPRGSVTGYLGVNGAGKSTTIKVLVGINAPSGGHATIAGHPVGGRAAQLRLGYFPEAPFFYDGLSARELLDFFGRISGLEREARRRRAAELLAAVGLVGAEDQPVKGFSKGMRQRLGLAQALLHDPELLVLDEPLDGLDPMGRLHLRELIAAQAAQGRTVFFSSHVLPDVEAVSDHLVVLDGGRVAYEGAVGGFCGEDARREVEWRPPAGRADALHQELTELAGGAPTERAGGVLALVCPTQQVTDEVLRRLCAAEASVLAVRDHRRSLEETFMERFGGEARA